MIYHRITTILFILSGIPGVLFFFGDIEWLSMNSSLIILGIGGLLNLHSEVIRGEIRDRNQNVKSSEEPNHFFIYASIKCVFFSIPIFIGLSDWVIDFLF